MSLNFHINQALNGTATSNLQIEADMLGYHLKARGEADWNSAMFNLIQARLDAAGGGGDQNVDLYHYKPNTVGGGANGRIDASTMDKVRTRECTEDSTARTGWDTAQGHNVFEQMYLDALFGFMLQDGGSADPKVIDQTAARASRTNPTDAALAPLTLNVYTSFEDCLKSIGSNHESALYKGFTNDQMETFVDILTSNGRLQTSSSSGADLHVRGGDVCSFTLNIEITNYSGSSSPGKVYKYANHQVLETNNVSTAPTPGTLAVRMELKHRHGLVITAVDSSNPAMINSASTEVSGAVTLTFTLSEKPGGGSAFAEADVTPTNCTLSNFAVVQSSGGKVFTATGTPGATGAVKIEVPADAYKDASSQGNLVATPFQFESVA